MFSLQSLRHLPDKLTPSFSVSFGGNSFKTLRKTMGGIFSDFVETVIPPEPVPNEAEFLSEEDMKQHSVLNGPFKMVLCVNMGLSMGKGKMAAQCCHATLGAYRVAVKKTPRTVQMWEYSGQAKIAVKVENDEKMASIQQAAKAAGLVTYQVHDTGKTQIAFGSKTVLAIGPAPVSAFEGITSDLKLL